MSGLIQCTKRCIQMDDGAFEFPFSLIFLQLYVADAAYLCGVTIHNQEELKSVCRNG